MKTWNVTGLYKHSRDRMPRKSRLRGHYPTAKLVSIELPPLCDNCGFALDTKAHKMLCSPVNDR